MSITIGLAFVVVAVPVFLDPLLADGRLLARPRSKEALVRQLRDYLHQVCQALGLFTRIVPHQLRHTYCLGDASSWRWLARGNETTWPYLSRDAHAIS
jgi:integrase